MKQENSIYIAGPMTGKVDHNYPAFRSAAQFLRDKGWTVFSPAEICEPGMPWSCCMRKDLAELVKCEAIFMLSGWKESKGATLELHVAERLGMTVIFERVEQ